MFVSLCLIFCILIFHISKKIANFWQKKNSKIREKNESAISRQTDGQRKMNAHGSFETEHFFCLALKINNLPAKMKTPK